MPHRTQGSVTGGASPGRGRAWQPQLQGVWRQRALEAIRAIARALHAGCAAAAHQDAAVDASLGGGATGLALMFAYLAEWRATAEDEAAARHWLEQAIAFEAIVERMRSLCAALGTPVVRTMEGLAAPDSRAEWTTGPWGPGPCP
jgi:hypothetical protein